MCRICTREHDSVSMNIGSIAFWACVLVAAWLFGSSTLGTVLVLVREKRQPTALETGGIIGGIVYALILGVLACAGKPQGKTTGVVIAFGSVALGCAFISFRARSSPSCARSDCSQPPEGSPKQYRCPRFLRAAVAACCTALAVAFLRYGNEPGNRVLGVLVPLSDVPARLGLSLFAGFLVGLWTFLGRKGKEKP
jgi:hypothetical protein